MTTWNTNPFLKKKTKNAAENKINSRVKGENPTKQEYKRSILEMTLSQLKKFCNASNT